LQPKSNSDIGMLWRFLHELVVCEPAHAFLLPQVGDADLQPRIDVMPKKRLAARDGVRRIDRIENPLNRFA
jgi:hypothetical protein